MRTRKKLRGLVEYAVDMSIPWRLLAVGLFSASAGGSAWAQATAPVPLAVGNSVTAYGLTATISGFTCPTGTGISCSSTDELAYVSTGRGTITFEILNSAGLPSAIFSNTSGTSQTMSLVLSITPNTTYQPTGGKVSSAVLTTTGVDQATSGSPVVRGSAAFSGGAVATSLTDTLTVGTGTASPVVSAPSTFQTASNAFTVTETLTINANGAAGTSLSLNLLALKLSTVPEPATGAVVLAGLTGLAMVRRRRTLGLYPTSN